MIGQHLDAPDIADPDLIIRTSGEQRLSQTFCSGRRPIRAGVHAGVWPDFDRAALEAAIEEYRRRERRFGGLAARRPPKCPQRRRDARSNLTLRIISSA
jgi:undecaprenyl diphosphate synthase